MAELPTKESVFGSRAIPQANTTVYSYNVGQEARASQRVGESITKVAGDMENVAKQRQKDLEELDLIRAQTFAFKEYATLENEMRNDPDQSWDKYQPLFAQRAEAAASVIKNPQIAEKFRLGLERDIVRRQVLSSELTEKRYDDESVAEFIRTGESNKDMAVRLLQSGDTDGAKVLLDQLERESLARAKAGVGNRSMVDHEQFVFGDLQKARADVLLNAFGQDEPEKIQEFLTGSDYITRLMQLESFGGNPLAKNPNSSAKGRFQFTSDTANRYGITATFGTPEYEAQEIDAMRRLTSDNRTGLVKSLGREPEDWELYLAHQQGIGGARALLSNPNAKAIDVLLPLYKNEQTAKDAIENNGGNLNMTASEFASKWKSKFTGTPNKIDNTAMFQSPIGYLSPSTQSALEAAVQDRLKQVMPDRIGADVTFAPANTLPALQQKYAGFDDAFSKQVQKRNELLKADPAGYASQSPNVTAYYEQMSQNPNDATARKNYFTALENEQRQLGLQTYEVKYVPKGEVEQIQTMLKSEPTVDSLNSQSQKLITSYGERLPEVLSQMRQEKVSGGFIDYMLMADGQDGAARASLSSAIVAGSDKLKSITGVKQSDLTDKIKSEMGDVMSAWSKGDKTNLSLIAPQKMESMELLTLQKMSEGMPLDDAVKYSKDVLLPYKVIDNMAIPKTFDDVKAKNIALSAQMAKESIAYLDIELPPQLVSLSGGDLAVAKSMFNEYVRDNVHPVINGDKILFYDDTGNPLLDASKIKNRDENGLPLKDANGQIIDFEDALYSRSISRVSAVSGADNKGASDLIQARADLVKYTNETDIALTKFNRGFMSRFSSTFGGAPDENNPTFIIVEPLTADDIRGKTVAIQTPRGEAYAPIDGEKKKARVNHTYFQKVLNSLPKDAQSRLIELANKSNEAHVGLADVKKRMKPQLNRNDGGLNYGDLMAQKEMYEELIDQGIGYNYIELPDWAK